ncbi:MULTISPECIES: hypothetical protein [Brevibacillus]|jgi:hypothetical protein|uniref:Uncharacterized protein n=1 Tax=Brevibacillus thermoruber TaxID=33942 RepID=A0A9X3TMP1_9BACL|nr:MULTISPECIES: hypothetical protein [Brevibacillus]MDA5107172.1 hypothetical protein [Brevibacillus thermoruber]TRY25043.1 hypothetical protein FOI68_14165 [Brevibacillus sp. LEMMJ03]UYZ11557.1 hypothetical protein A6764_11815 [Brevibacillus sp. WF146]
MAKPKKAKTNRESRQHPNQLNLKIVTSETCKVCKQPCARGMAYVDKMSRPGAIGCGVPCILTAPRS